MKDVDKYSSNTPEKIVKYKYYIIKALCTL